ncbi:MAG TPA: hypothetical protein VG944_00440 [Fimbriimonas sp.]|nr:hypothetical protein [Fimbriimonas sp.]
MQFAQQSDESRDGEQSGTDLGDLLLKDEEIFQLFVEECLKQGVSLPSEEDFVALLTKNQDGVGARSGQADLSAMVQVALDMVKYREGKVEAPQRAAVSPSVSPRTESKIEAPTGVEERILGKLGWQPNSPESSKNLKRLLDKMTEAGITDPDSYLSLRDAAQTCEIAERTLRRYIADGALPTEKVKGPRGWEHRVYVPSLFLVLQEKAGAIERARSSPMEDMGREIAALCRVIVEQQTISDRRTDKLLDEIRNQSRVIDELRAEQRDARAQMHGIQEQMIRALMPRQKPSFWQRISGQA